MISSKEFQIFDLIIKNKRLVVGPIGYQQITELNLSHLNLIEIDSFSLIYFPRLKKLDLSHNNLRKIDVNWAKSTNNSIEYLNLSFNYLETLNFLKNFHFLRWIDLSSNKIRENERFLVLYLCSTVECLIDDHRDQTENDRSALTKFFDFSQRKFDEFRENFEKNQIDGEISFENFLQTISNGVELSASEIYFFENQFYLYYRSFQQSRFQSTINTEILEDLTRSMSLNEKKTCQLKYLFRSHHHSDENLCSTPVYRSIFQAKTDRNLLATCGGKKICWTDCDHGKITHFFELPTTNQTENQEKFLPAECFISLCSIEIERENEIFEFIAAGTSYGNIYLVSSKWNLMFGKIKIPGSPIRGLNWNRDDPLTLVVASDFTIRCVHLFSYVSRLESFVEKLNKSTSNLFINKTTITHVFHLNGDYQEKARLFITDVLCYSLTTGNNPVILVGTTAGLFLVRYREEKNEQSVIQLVLPKPIWTISEQIESLCLIQTETPLIAMTVLGLDKICCFNLDQAVQTQRVQVFISFSSPARFFPTKISVSKPEDPKSKSFQCFVGTQNGSVFHHSVHWKTKSSKYSTVDCQHHFQEFFFSDQKFSPMPTVLSTSVNENFFVCTTTNNLICIYER